MYVRCSVATPSEAELLSEGDAVGPPFLFTDVLQTATAAVGITRVH
jgi:hypothetical protein